MEEIGKTLYESDHWHCTGKKSVGFGENSHNEKVKRGFKGAVHKILSD